MGEFVFDWGEGVIGGVSAARGPRVVVIDGLDDDTIRLADANLTGSGETVLGHHSDGCVDLAQERGASYFDIGDAWGGLTVSQQWAANLRVLDAAIANGDTITLATPRGRIRLGTSLVEEMRYLEANGYVWVDDVTLVPG